MARNISDNGLRFTAAWESFRSAPYFATDNERTRGIYTIGYGHTTTKPPQRNITQQEALQLLKEDMAKAVSFADRYAHPSLNQAQFDAVCDICFNVGVGIILKDNILGDFDDAVRNGDIAAIQTKLPQFNKQAGVVVKGLQRRANGRLALFNGADWITAEHMGRNSVK